MAEDSEDEFVPDLGELTIEEYAELLHQVEGIRKLKNDVGH